MRSWTKRTKVLSAAALVLVVVTIVASRRGGNTVDVGKVEKGSIIEAVYGLGTVTARQMYQMRLGFTATLLQVHVREGERVSKGAPLVLLDGVTLLRAPFAGTVTALPFKVGETVFPQVPILTLVDLADRYVIVQLEQEGALKVRSGQPAHLRIDSMKGQKFEGSVRSVYSHETQFLADIQIKDLPAAILPGMTLDVAIEISKKNDVLVAPAAALDKGTLRVRRGGGARQVPVEVGLRDGDRVEIVSGDVQAGDMACVIGASK